MFVTTLAFKLDNALDRQSLVHLIYELMSGLATNGQAESNEPIVSLDAGVCSIWFHTPEIDSFSLYNHSSDVNDALLKFENLGIEIEVQTGPEPFMQIDMCKCKKNSAFLLYATCLENESPIRCLKCFRQIPLYQISNSHKKAISGISHWASDYRCCDQLQIGCRVLEKQAIEEMSKWNSDLSKQGMGLAKRVAKATGVPVYYYLYRHKGESLKSELERRCPKCRRKWRLKKKLHDFDFRCDKCLIVSNIAFDLSG